MTTEKPNVWRELGALVAHRRPLVIIVLVASIAASLAEGVGAGFIVALIDATRDGTGISSGLPALGALVNSVAEYSLEQRVRAAGLLLLALLVVRGGLYYASRVLSTWLEEGVVRDLRRRLYHRLIGREFVTLSTQRGGDFLTALEKYTTDVGVMVRLLGFSVVLVSTILVYLTVLLFVSWQMTTVVAALLGVSSLLVRNLFRDRQTEAGKTANRAAARLNSFGLESLAALPLVRVFQQEDRFRARFDRLLDERERAARRRSVLAQLNRPIFVTANALALCLLMIISTWVLAPQLNGWIGYMVLFLVIALRLLAPAVAVAGLRGQLSTLAPSLLAVGDLLTPDDRSGSKQPQPDSLISFAGLEDSVLFDNVSFSYPGSREPVVRGVSFVLKKGTTTGLVGPSGSGKTTIANLLAGLIEPDDGQIRIDGIDLLQLEAGSWRRRLAMAIQETFLFHESVLENIRFGRQEATRDEVEEAARQANALDFIKRLPEGFDTIVGDRGSRLSAGQRQRLAIARAILREPEVLILDEATSSLDSDSELRVRRALSNVRRSRTVLIVAHRLETIRDADNIVVLDAGEVTQQGTHEALMKRPGLYCRLVEAQSVRTLAG